jgi:hypothetical protein
VQALGRAQPLLTLEMGNVEEASHDSMRHTTTPLAALDLATGQLIAPCKPRHRQQK